MFTKEMIGEWLKCEKDFYYFSEKYLGFDFSEFRLTENRFIKFIAARQTGKTNFLAAYGLWSILFKNDYYVLHVSHCHDESKRCKEYVKDLYAKVCNSIFGNSLGKVASDHSRIFGFENGSAIYFQSGSCAGRGMAFNAVLLDEAAYFKDLEGLYTALYPIIATGHKTKMIIATTPSGNGNMSLLNSLSRFDTITVFSKRSKEYLEKTKEILGKESYNIEFLGDRV